MGDYIHEYHAKIESGEIIAGKWIRFLYRYIVEGLENGSFYFAPNKADEAIEWIENNCYHTEGPLAPNLLKLELWQKAALSVMFGIVDSTDKRIFREVVIVVSRKNGKSLLASAIANYVWKCGGYGTRVLYCSKA